MFEKTYHATHPDMMEDASNEDLRARYLIAGLFKPDQVALNYCHNERMVIGGAAPGEGDGRASRADRAGIRQGQALPRAARTRRDQCRRRRGRDHRRWRSAYDEPARRALHPDGLGEGGVQIRPIQRSPRNSISSPRPRTRATRSPRSRSTRPCRWSAARRRHRTSAPSISSSCRQQ